MSDLLNPFSLDKEIKDEELRIGIHNTGGFVVIQFNRPIQVIQITKQQAKEMAARLVKVAMK